MSRFKKAIKKKELESALAKHPLRELDEQVKKDYVKGLVFIATEDENFDEDEIAYVVSLMKNIGLDEALLEEFTTFVSDCEEEELLEFMDRLKAFDEDIKINFLIEVVVISFKDGNFDDSEKEMFADYLDMLELKDKEDDIMYMATALVNKDTDLALSIYTAKKEFFLKYDYMFDMIDIDVEKELKTLYSWEWVEFRLDSGEVEDNNLVASKPVTAKQYCVYLNSLIIDETLYQLPNTTKFEIDNVAIITDMQKVNLEKSEKLFSYADGEEENDIVGLTSDAPNLFSDWVNTKTNNITKGLKIIADNDSIVLHESAKGFLTDNFEQFIAYISYKSQGDKVRFIDVSGSCYGYYNFKEYCALESNVNYAFRLMKAKEEE
jgi:uncharacterized tellurite resistance protein B-like protein